MKPSVTSSTFHHTVQHVDETTFHTHVMAVTTKTDKKPVVAVVADIGCYIQRPHFPWDTNEKQKSLHKLLHLKNISATALFVPIATKDSICSRCSADLAPFLQSAHVRVYARVIHHAKHLCQVTISGYEQLRPQHWQRRTNRVSRVCAHAHV